MYFNWVMKAWQNGWASESDILIWKNAGRLTDEEYEEIISTHRAGD